VFETLIDDVVSLIELLPVELLPVELLPVLVTVVVEVEPFFCVTVDLLPEVVVGGPAAVEDGRVVMGV